MLPFEEDLTLLDTIPGVGRRIAEQIIAETGTNMDQFPSTAHLCSWGETVPRSERKCRETKIYKDSKREQEITKRPCRGCPGRLKNKRYLSFQSIPSHCGTQWIEPGSSCCCSQHSNYSLSYSQAKATLYRTGPQLLRREKAQHSHPAVFEKAGIFRVKGHG